MLGFGAIGELALGQETNSDTINLIADFFTDADVFYSTVQLNQKVHVSLYSNIDDFYASKFTQTLADTVLINTNANSFFSSKVSLKLHKSSLDIDEDNFYAPKLNIILLANRYNDPDSFLAEAWKIFPKFFTDNSEYVSKPSLKQTFKVTPKDFNHNIRPTIFKDGFRRKNPLRRDKKS